MKGKTYAGPGNYFITLDRDGLRFPLPTAEYVKINPGQHFDVHKKNDDLLLIVRCKESNITSILYRNFIKMHHRIRLNRKCFTFGRYHYMETLGDILVFKHDPTWV